MALPQSSTHLGSPPPLQSSPCMQLPRHHQSPRHQMSPRHQLSPLQRPPSRLQPSPRLQSPMRLDAEMPLLSRSPPIAEVKPNVSISIKKEEKPDISPPLLFGPVDLPKPLSRRASAAACAVCGFTAATAAARAAHLLVHPLECLECGKLFARRSAFVAHRFTHAPRTARPHRCPLCPKSFITRQKLREHHNAHTGAAPIKCTDCERHFRRYSNMVQHRARVHRGRRPPQRTLHCHCGEAFRSKAKLAWHQETHAPRPHACPRCPDKFVHRVSLTRHLRRTHGAHDANDVPCPVCRRPVRRSSLPMHVRTHAAPALRPHRCSVCGKGFSTTWNLRVHRFAHLPRSQQPHRCGACPATFVRAGDLRAHAAAHRRVRPFACDVCGRRFVRKANCVRHMREHAAVKRFVCDVAGCGKRFHRSYYLTEHARVHSGARPFACAVCGKTSASKSNHNKHVRIHHARDPLPPEA